MVQPLHRSRDAPLPAWAPVVRSRVAQLPLVDAPFPCLVVQCGQVPPGCRQVHGRPAKPLARSAQAPPVAVSGIPAGLPAEGRPMEWHRRDRKSPSTMATRKLELAHICSSCRRRVARIQISRTVGAPRCAGVRPDVQLDGGLTGTRLLPGAPVPTEPSRPCLKKNRYQYQLPRLSRGFLSDLILPLHRGPLLAASAPYMERDPTKTQWTAQLAPGRSQNPP